MKAEYPRVEGWGYVSFPTPPGWELEKRVLDIPDGRRTGVVSFHFVNTNQNSLPSINESSFAEQTSVTDLVPDLANPAEKAVS